MSGYAEPPRGYSFPTPPSGGRLKLKVLPLPTLLSNQMRPPWRSTISLEMCSPSPAPSILRAWTVAGPLGCHPQRSEGSPLPPQEMLRSHFQHDRVVASAVPFVGPAREH